MPKYRKKPIVVDAELWRPDCLEQPKPGDEDALGVIWQYDGFGQVVSGRMQTLQGFFVVTIGDWIITSMQGEKSRCKPDIFEQTYEKVEE